MSLLEFIVDKTGIYGILMISVTSLYAALFFNAVWELGALTILKPEAYAKRVSAKKIIKFFTACNDIVKLAAIAGFFMTLLGFQQVISGFASFDKSVALDGMSLAVMSSACYVPIVALAALWLLLTRTITTVRPDIKEFIWAEEDSEATQAQGAS